MAVSPKTEPAAVPDTLSVTLRTPIEFGGQTYSRIDLREPTAKQYRQLRGLPPSEASIELIFQVSGVLPAVVEKIGARDARRISEWLNVVCSVPPSPPDPPETLDVRLRTPLTHDDGTLFALKLREPTMGELKKLDGLSGVEETATLIGLMNDTPASVIEQIGIRDFRVAEAYLAAFL